MTTLCFIDTETTGLDPRIHQPYEVCWWREDEDTPNTVRLPHTLDHADPRALEIGGYHEREVEPGWSWPDRWLNVDELGMQLSGVTLVGANPSFDAAMLAPLLRHQPWHYRFIDVSTGAMWLLGWDRPRSLLDTAAALRDAGHAIPLPDHTAEGDVRTTRAVYDALRRLGHKGDE